MCTKPNVCPSRIDNNGRFNCSECQKRIVFFQLDRNNIDSLEHYKCLNRDDEKLWEFKDEILFFDDSSLAKNQLTQGHTIVLKTTDKIARLKLYNHFICENHSTKEVFLTSLIVLILLIIGFLIYLGYKFIKKLDFTSLICKYFEKYFN